jgi:nucleotide-binding universal stress UspA family protein
MKILFATDGSENSEEAARFLTRFAFSEHDSIVVLHVISEIPYEDDYYAQIKHAIRKVAPKILSAAEDILRPVKARVLTREEEGYPDTTIVDIASGSDMDLIVMGARGVKGIKRLFLGSSTRSVAINSPNPVLVVKHSPWGERSGAMKILFAVDGSEASLETAKTLNAIPFPEDTEVTIMHVLWSAVSDIPEKFAIEIDERVKTDVAQIREAEYGSSEKLIEGFRDKLSGRFRKIKSVIKPGDPSIEILEAEKIMEPDITAVGCLGIRGVRGMMGSVSRRVLGHSKSSVLIGKACSGTL